MIITRLYGGMGNQMFQYAFGRTLAEKYHTDLYLDIRPLLDRTPKAYFTFRDFDLDLFNIKAELLPENIANDLTIEFTRIENFKTKLRKLFNIKSFINNYYHARETTFAFNRCIFHSPDNTLLDGYWQSEKYFIDIKEKIINELTLKEIPQGKIIEIENYIKDYDSICIQVRRGDYISNPLNRIIHGVLQEDYYKKSVEYITKNVSKPIIIIVSDDNNWCRENLKFNNIETIIIEDEWKGKRFQNSMYIMNKCKHFVISNSSFGWWGAYLSQNENKIVIAPKKWFNIPIHNYKDVIPKQWIKL